MICIKSDLDPQFQFLLHIFFGTKIDGDWVGERGIFKSISQPVFSVNVKMQITKFKNFEGEMKRGRKKLKRENPPFGF